MRQPFRARPKPFLDEPRRDWQFATFAWLLRQNGGYAGFLECVPVLPIEEHFPDRGLSGHAAVAALFRRVRDHAGMADWPCMVEPRAGARIARGDVEHVGRVIYYDPAQRNAGLLVARFAVELARYLADTLEEPPPGGLGFLAPAAEVAAVFMGFGVFLANAAVATGEGALNEAERIHALAMFCTLRNVALPAIEPHLDPHLRKYLRMATLDLGQHRARFAQLREIQCDATEQADRTTHAAG